MNTVTTIVYSNINNKNVHAIGTKICKSHFWFRENQQNTKIKKEAFQNAFGFGVKDRLDEEV